jgi:hypothetical protein
VFAFARRYQNNWVVVAVPLFVAKLARSQKCKVEEIKWKNTRLVLPAGVHEAITDLCTGERTKRDDQLFVKSFFNRMPFLVLESKREQSNRGAGILLHVTSLPSPFGIGDFGPEAYEFANYLSESGQKYWQLLPLSPTEESQGYSPYSALSSMAGNTLLISPELLAREGLLNESVFQDYYVKGKNEVDYASAKQIKDRLFTEAYHNFSTSAAGR